MSPKKVNMNDEASHFCGSLVLFPVFVIFFCLVQWFLNVINNMNVSLSMNESLEFTVVYCKSHGEQKNLISSKIKKYVK